MDNHIRENQWMKYHLQRIFCRPVIFFPLTFAFFVIYFWYSSLPIQYSSDGKLLKTRTILISLDGFRYDYMDKVKATGRKIPTLDALVKTGVKADRLLPVFVTRTMPSHQSMVTGLYTESHGFVSNVIIDPRYPHEKWSMMNQKSLNDPKFYVGLPEPIWVTCQKQGCLSASMLWPHADTKINDILPFKQVSQFIQLNDESNRYPYASRINDVIGWLTSKLFHIDVVLMYFDEPDMIGHMYGPATEPVFDKIVELDKYLGQFVQLLKKHNLYDEVNIILTSDHGMGEVSSERQIALNDYVDPSLYTYSVLRPVSSIFPKKGHEKIVYDKLKGAHPNYHVYWKKEVPERLHYSNSDRIGDIVGISDEGWHVVQQRLTNTWTGGNHGYDNQIPNMQSFFIAHGPSFKENYSVSVIEMVDIYPLMCHLLNIQPNPNNGSLHRIGHILKQNAKPILKQRTFYTNYHYLALCFAIFLLVSILFVRYRKRE